MNKKLKAKWIEALRSGKYKQAQNVLWDEGRDAYCCVGVLCRIQGASDEFLFKNRKMLNVSEYADGMGAEDFRPYAKMNDEGKTFAEIAKEIKSRL